MCSKHKTCCGSLGGLSRRELLQAGVVFSVATVAPTSAAQQATKLQVAQEENPPMRRGAKPLRVLPVLLYSIPRRAEARSWRNWGGLQSEQAVQEESNRIGRELQQLAAEVDFELEILPLQLVSSAQQAANVKEQNKDCDVVLIYAAGGWTNSLGILCEVGNWPIVFLRYRSGPYYLWHEIVHARFLRAHSDQLKHPKLKLEDIVVDDQQELKWRLAALYGLKNVLGRKIICVGGPGGWAAPNAPKLAQERFGLQMITVEIPDVCAMIEAGRKNEALMQQCMQAAEAYISAPGVTLRTTKQAVAECFLLKALFKQLMAEHDAWAVTTRGCMASYARIMPCLTLTLLNDDGYMAYCEGDFVVIPAGMLLHFITGQPTYFCNPTFPFQGRMMFAHCTAPRRMNGKRLEPVELVTHYESDWGAATHVLFPKGQLLTVVKPDFEAKNWLTMTGTVNDTPFIDTCRAQVEVKLHADERQVQENLRGFHCMLVYGDFRKHVQYAASKVGIDVTVLG